MGTRCSIIVKDKFESFTLYRSCDGYPDCAGVVLKKHLAEWRYLDAPEVATKIVQISEALGYPYKDSCSYPFEIASSIPGDIEYLYIIDLSNLTITCYSTGRLIGVYDDFTEELIVENCETREIPDKERGE